MENLKKKCGRSVKILKNYAKLIWGARLGEYFMKEEET